MKRSFLTVIFILLISIQSAFSQKVENPYSNLVGQDVLSFDRIVNQAIADSVFPGATVLVCSSDKILFKKNYGYFSYEKYQAVPEDAIYDLASLTKVVATTTTMMKVQSLGLLKPDDTVSKYIPEYNTPQKKDIQIKDLLMHQSGLPAFRVLVDRFKDRASIVDFIRKDTLVEPTASTYTYSDWNFIINAEILESITKVRLDKLADSLVFKPLGMNSTTFNPINTHPEWIKRIPPTELDTYFVRGQVRGAAHDERAYYMEGVAGHAGLFSSAEDLSKWAQMLLKKGLNNGLVFLPSSIINKYSTRQSKFANRGYGFDRKRGTISSGGSLTSDATFGHTGFTGTSIWIDPQNDLAIIVLSNRTYPNRSFGANIYKVRSAIADAAIRCFVATE